MNCPYCSSIASKVRTGNEENNINELYVGEECETCNECYDFEISMWQCSKNLKHIFYADDLAGSLIDSSIQEMKRDVDWP